MNKQPPHVRVVTETEAREMAQYYYDGGECWLAKQWKLRADELAATPAQQEQEPTR